MLVPLLPSGAAIDEPKTPEGLLPLRPRFFSPREIANLHGFPADFNFPDSISRKKRYELLGNSLSVQVLGRLLGFLFALPVSAPPSVAPAGSGAQEVAGVSPQFTGCSAIHAV